MMPNIWMQATPVLAFLFVLDSLTGALDPERCAYEA